MGWLYMQSLGGFAGPRQYLDDQFSYERPDGRVRVLRSALVAFRTYYAAVEIVGSTGERAVTALICLVRYNPRDREGYVFGYKDMTESMGPCEAECPLSILDLLTPTDAPYAIAWRDRCRAHAARRTTRPKLRAGQIIALDTPITFSDGARLDRLEIVVDRQRPRAIRFRSLDGGGFYRISGLAKLNYRVADEAPG